ncbi:MAG TPA: hypothetical protein VK563_00040 [Puia sp.]|nr:hypothetical protein [Puia sp.]
MQKNTLICLLFLSISMLSQAQSPGTKRIIYYDACYLDSFLLKGGKIKLQADNIDLFNYYFNTEKKSGSQVNKAILANPFFTTDIFDTTGGAQADKTFSIPAFFSGGSVGGLDVTNIANGIADLLIERAKQELTVAFFDRFKKFSEKNPEFALLFPKTTDNLSKLLTYTYPQMLPALRDGFFEDLKKITFHLDDVLALPRYRSLLKNYPEVKIAIRSLRLIHELETGASNAADVIQEFAKFTEWNDKTQPALKNAGNYLRIASLFSESIRNDSTRSHKKTAWVSGKELKKIFTDKNLFTIYMGLLYQQSMNDTLTLLVAGSEKPFADLLKPAALDLFVFQNKLKEFFDLADKVDATYTDIETKKSSGRSLSNDDYYNYINVAIDVVDYGFGIAGIFDTTTVSANYLAVARKSNTIYKDIYTKQYTQAVGDVLDVFSLLQTLINGRIGFDKLRLDPAIVNYKGPAKEKEIVDRLASTNTSIVIKDEDLAQLISAAIADQHTKDLIQQLIQHYHLDRLLDFIGKMKPYALFMANMVEAKDENAVKAALDNVILPVGSSSIKKNTACNISVQAYLGAFVSTSNGNNASLSTWSDKFGVIAPIGISWTPGWSSFGNGGAISLFGSLFDLGAIVDYKLKKDPSVTGGDSLVSKDYSVKLGQLFSPGAYLVYGAGGNLPLSLGIGGQYGPGLSKIDPGNGIAVINPSWRWSLFLAVDLPFFNLVNKTRSSQR